MFARNLLYFERVCPAGGKQSRPLSLGFGFLEWAQALAVCRLQEVLPCSCMEHFPSSNWFHARQIQSSCFEGISCSTSCSSTSGKLFCCLMSPMWIEAKSREVQGCFCSYWKTHLPASRAAAYGSRLLPAADGGLQVWCWSGRGFEIEQPIFWGFWWSSYHFPGDFGGFTFFFYFGGFAWVWLMVSVPWCWNAPPSCWGEDRNLRTSPVDTTGRAGICYDNPQIHQRGEGAGWLRRALDFWFKTNGIGTFEESKVGANLMIWGGFMSGNLNLKWISWAGLDLGWWLGTPAWQLGSSFWNPRGLVGTRGTDEAEQARDTESADASSSSSGSSEAPGWLGDGSEERFLAMGIFYTFVLKGLLILPLFIERSKDGMEKTKSRTVFFSLLSLETKAFWRLPEEWSGAIVEAGQMVPQLEDFGFPFAFWGFWFKFGGRLRKRSPGDSSV